MKKIKLTQGQYVLVDNEDFEELNKYKWYAHWDSHTKGFYAVRNARIENVKQYQTQIRMHRVIMNVSKGKYADHINHNTLDNRRFNLRICTNKQNTYNKKISKNNTSGFKGVSFHKGTRKFMAYIKVDGKLIYLGIYPTSEQAALVYNQAAIKHYKEFALLNNI